MAKRKDALANKARLMEAAFDLLAKRDADLTVRELAVATGLGIGTAYRHFPTHDDLIRDLYAHGVATLSAGLAAPDPQLSAWESIAELMQSSALALAGSPGLRIVMRRMYEVDPRHRPATHFIDVFRRLIKQAQADGDMRPGITAADIALSVFAVGGLVGHPTDAEQRLMRRHLIITLDGMRAEGRVSKLPADTLNAEEFHGFLHRSNAPLAW